MTEYAGRRRARHANRMAENDDQLARSKAGASDRHRADGEVAGTYTPGWGSRAVSFMADRRVETHAEFFLPQLMPGMNVLDLGCGPGSITLGLAAAVAPGAVLGLDAGAAQLEVAVRAAVEHGVENVRFDTGSCYAIPLGDESVDRVFSHALLEHLAEPERALAEARRVLVAGGMIGICCPAWDGFLLAPPADQVDAAIDAYQKLQAANGGDPLVGRRLGQLLDAAGFTEIRLDARYERYVDVRRIAEYLAEQLEVAEEPAHAEALRWWAGQPAAMFAQAWVSATARRPISASE